MKRYFIINWGITPWEFILNILIDCEFDTPTETLISMGLITEDGVHEFYEVLDCSEVQDQWVKENVLPILQKEPISWPDFQLKLGKWLGQFAGVNIIANHPNDVYYFCKAIMGEQGKWIKVQPLTFEIDDAVSGKKSKCLHNAIFDARAQREHWLELQGYK